MQCNILVTANKAKNCLQRKKNHIDIIFIWHNLGGSKAILLRKGEFECHMMAFSESLPFSWKTVIKDVLKKNKRI